jgi:hypothetical protein
VGPDLPSTNEHQVFDYKRTAVRLGLPTDLWTSRSQHWSTTINKYKPDYIWDLNIYKECQNEIDRLQDNGQVSPDMYEAMNDTLDDIRDLLLDKAFDNYMNQQTANDFDDDNDLDDVKELLYMHVFYCDDYNEFVKKRDDIFDEVLDHYWFKMPPIPRQIDFDSVESPTKKQKVIDLTDL